MFNLAYLAFRVGPFILVSSFILLSIINFDFKCVIYLAGLLISLGATRMIDNMIPKSQGTDVSHKCGLISMKFQNPNRQTDNYIDWSKNKIVLNDYKTVREYGQVVLPLKPEVKQAILATRRDNTSDYLITDNQGRPYTESALSKKIKSVMGYCVDDLRSMYITYNYEEGNLHTEEQKIEFCKGMRNSPSVLKYYIKF